MNIKRTKKELLDELIQSKDYNAKLEHKYNNVFRTISDVKHNVKNMKKNKYFTTESMALFITRLEKEIKERNDKYFT